MARTVTYKVGLVGHDKYVVEGARQELTVQIHDLEAEPWGREAKLKHVGTDVQRLDGPQKATGTAKYTYDVRPAEMAFAGLVTCPHAHAEVKAVDTSAAEAMAGVLAVKAHQGRRATYAGAIVAAVCAESEGVLDDALHAIRVTYDVKPGPCVTEDAMQPGAPTVDPRRDDNIGRAGGRRTGDAARAFEAAEARVEAEYRTAIQTHSCLEPHGCTVVPAPDGTATVWASTQATSRFASGRFASAMGLRPGQVRTRTEHMGGGFGSKFSALEWDVLCAEFARKTQRPVQLLLTRRLEHLIGGNRPDSIQKMGLAGSKDGSFRALRGETWGTSGNAAGGGAGTANYSVYDFPVVDMVQNGVATFSARGAAFRAPRHPQGFFALESLIDKFAYEIGMDALEVRKKNDPHPIRQAQWQIGAERIAWAKQRRKPAGSDEGPVKRGVGCAASRWGQAGRHMVGRNTVLRVGLRLDREGGAAVECCVQDLGTGTRTVMAVLVAEELGLDPADIEVRIGDSHLLPGPGSGGSTTTPSIGPVVRNAAVRAKEALADLLASEWGVEAKEITWTGSGFAAPGGKQATWAQACSLVPADGLRVEGERRPNWKSPFGETAGCQFAQVAVDTETGVISVEKVVAVHDAGRLVNALAARSQVNGGVIQGISYALYEEKQLDRNLGDMVNATLDTYRILGMADCPEIDVVLTSVVSGYNNAGLMGLGEPATVPTAGAIANAVTNAIGVQVTQLPMTPARVLEALERSRG